MFKNGDIVELTRDLSIYKSGKKAHFINFESKTRANIVWFGDEDEYSKYGDTEVIPINMIKLSEKVK